MNGQIPTMLLSSRQAIYVKQTLMYGNLSYKCFFVREKHVLLPFNIKNMERIQRKKEDSRVEFRVSKKDKELFEYASSLKGFKSFSEFARLVIHKEVKAIVEEEKRILISKRDKEIFFNALMGKEEKPNEALISAIKFHHELGTI
jgi:uncharacterized protein (DUF1778 family)